MTHPTAIAADRVSKRYADILALDDLCLEIGTGTLFGFLGPNGAGKSTTLNCLTGLTDPSCGEIRLAGEPLTRRSCSIKRRIGVVPEGLALFDQLRADEFLAFNGRMFGLDEETLRCRARELLDAFGLTAACSRPLGEFSEGMRKKVALASAIIHLPQILFLDEPFSGMDPASVSMVKMWLRRFAARGGTVFLTSHALETVERLCDEVAVIRAGRLVWRGDIRRFAGGGVVEHQGSAFATLESLFLHLVGEPSADLTWF
jgi:ABC-2 type transport system ATP-binding protein